MAEDEVQYHIEIQDCEEFDQANGEVMVVLDLNGQDLPESVAQTIIELAQNTRQTQAVDAEQLSQLAVEGTQNQEQNGDVVNVFNNQQTELFSNEPNPAIADGTDLISGLKLEEVDGAFNTQELVQTVNEGKNKNTPRLIVRNLSELERIKTGKRIPNVKVEMGVQCELINPSERNKSDVSQHSIGYEKIDSTFIQDGCMENIKTEPMWAEGDKDFATKPAEPEEAAVIPSTPVVEKSCSQCEFTCSDDVELGRHMRKVHKEARPFTCSVCNATFERELSLQIHGLLHTEKPLRRKRIRRYCFICPVCSIECSTKKRLLTHAEKDHSQATLYTCDDCMFACLSQLELSEHKITQAHKKKVSKVSVCPVCQVACLRLSTHLLKNHKDYRPFLCSECGYKSKTKASLKLHMLTHTDKKEFVCPQCQRACKSHISLKRHMNNHNPVKRFLCSQCPYATNDSYEYKRHTKRVHSKKSYYSCRFCNLTFLQSCDLKLHSMSEHKSKDAHFCSYCDFSCETRLELKKHTQEHTGKHRFHCEMCEFTTPYKAHLERHRVTHTDLRPFKCSVCGYECREKINLKKHMVIHSDDKPFSCPMCPYKGKMKNQLDSHMRIVHTSLRPYCCTLCQYTTKTSSNLKKHMWIHERYKPHACRFCSYTAREKNKLIRHERAKHKNEFKGTEEVTISQPMDSFESYVIVTSVTPQKI